MNKMANKKEIIKLVELQIKKEYKSLLPDLSKEDKEQFLSFILGGDTMYIIVNKKNKKVIGYCNEAISIEDIDYKLCPPNEYWIYKCPDAIKEIVLNNTHGKISCDYKHQNYQESLTLN